MSAPEWMQHGRAALRRCSIRFLHLCGAVSKQNSADVPTVVMQGEFHWPAHMASIMAQEVAQLEVLKPPNAGRQKASQGLL